MIRRWIAAAAAALVCAQAIAQGPDLSQNLMPPPGPSLWAFEYFMSPDGHGIARVIGPLNGEDCATVTQQLRKAPTDDIPPDYQLSVAPRCGGKQDVQILIASRVCRAVDHQPLPKFKDYAVVFWLYNCRM